MRAPGVRIAVSRSFIATSSRLISIAGLVLAPLCAQGQATGSIDARLARIERSLSSSSLLEMHATMQQLRREVRELRGQIELQANQIQKLKASQRKLYGDLDQRISALGTSQPADPSAPVDASAPPTAPPATVTSAPQPAPVASAPAAAAPALAPAADPAAEQRAYQNAFALLKSGKYASASKAFDEFLREYPNGGYSDNAQYWLGESYYVSRKFDPALKAFEELLSSFPESPKRSHALLKIGFIHDEAGRPDQARKVLNDLVATDPQSTAAGLARKRLARLQ